MTVDSHEINNSSPYQALKKIMSLTLLFQEWFKGRLRRRMRPLNWVSSLPFSLVV
jgi:hypothetical protein